MALEFALELQRDSVRNAFWKNVSLFERREFECLSLGFFFSTYYCISNVQQNDWIIESLS